MSTSASQSDNYFARYAAHQTQQLNQAILETMKAKDLQWREAVKSGILPVPPTPFREVDFLGNGKPRDQWQKEWAGRAPALRWDAVGRIRPRQVGWEWLLVASMADPEELKLRRTKKFAPGFQRLVEAAKRHYRCPEQADWQEVAPQIAAQYTAFSFLRRSRVCSRMAHVFFYRPPKSSCKDFATKAEWQDALRQMRQQMGLSGNSPVEQRCYTVFLPANLD